VRVSIVVRGVVQGVGFRPFVHRTALSRELSGTVRNGRGAVHIEVQGDPGAVRAFVRAVEHDAPRPAKVASLDVVEIAERPEQAFTILGSDTAEPVAPALPPDLATCGDCLREVETPGERRYRYPFTNCTACGPRYSIALSLPYDRARTSMRDFVLCSGCEREYRVLDDRRYHAQPIACPTCGPALVLLSPSGAPLSRAEAALEGAVSALRQGRVLALRGIGGFQLVCDATRADAVARLRANKRRPHKPFAVMFPSLADIEREASLSAFERDLLLSPEAPIVLLERLPSSRLAPEVSSDSPYLGALLPYSPLHALLLSDSGAPLVCTSGNLSSEPICTSTEEALERLSAVADAILTHDRPIVRPLDDSVVAATSGRAVTLRRARGYAPLAVGQIDERATVLGLGAHAKSTITLGCRGALIPSQHLGDLDTFEARALLRRTATELCHFFDAKPRYLACDLHPDYASTRLAEELAVELGAPLLRVQHHHAHVAACMAEHRLEGRVLGLSWDGSGLGADGTIWGGEALVCDGTAYSRFAHLAPFPLPGGDRAAREPRRAALGALFAHVPDQCEPRMSSRFAGELERYLAALSRSLHAPLCSSVGRLFDAVAALLGVETVSYEGQAAMHVEQLARQVEALPPYSLKLERAPSGARVATLDTVLRELLEELDSGVERGRVARRFHDTLIAFGCLAAEQAAIEQVVLAGGCFQNRVLLQGLTVALERRGFRVYTPSALPPNDGGISVGQAFLAARSLLGKNAA
jgi:hydrogenase maturation protein HypF